MKKIVLIGKLYKKDLNNGPGAIIHKLQEQLQSNQMDHIAILLNEKTSNSKFIKTIINNVLFQSDRIVNVHTNGFLIPLLILLISKINRKNKYFLTVHGIYQIEAVIRGDKSEFYRKLEKFIYCKFPNLICVSNFLKENIRDLFKREKNVYVVENGTDATNILLNERKKSIEVPVKFVMAGGLFKRKGIFECIDLIDYLVNKKGIKVELDIYGNVESEMVEAEYLQLLEKCKLGDVIKYHGLITNKYELYEIYAKSDFNLCLSKYDTFNVSIIESMVLGCPCISSNNCGAVDYITDNMNGYVVNLDDSIHEIVYKIIILNSNNPTKYHEICEQAKDIRKFVNWDKVFVQYLNVLEK